MGVRRWIDYILVGARLDTVMATATYVWDIGLDHRAVRAKSGSPRDAHERHGPKHHDSVDGSDGWTPTGCPNDFQEALDEHLRDLPVNNTRDIEHALFNTASRTGSVPDVHAGTCKPWLSARVQKLIAARRAARSRAERASISKDIRKETRKGMRRYRTRIAEIVLQQFRGLDRIKHVHRQPVTATARTEPIKPECFADYFEEVYASTHAPLQVDRSALARVPPFTADEVKRAARRMANARCADEAGVVSEMIKYGSDLLHQRMTYNHVLRQGTFEPDWYHTMLTTLPKSGDLTDPGNWRPIAVLRTLCKLMSRILLHRLQPMLDAQQSADQFGFRPTCPIRDAPTVLESTCSKTAGFDVPLWLASLDLKK